MKKIYKGSIVFNGRKINCEVRDDVRYIEGKTVKEFIDTLNLGDMLFLEEVGRGVLTGKIKQKS